MEKLLNLIKQHEEWRRQHCLNLIPSETYVSPLLLRVLSTDLINRYTNVNKFYGGTKYLDEIETYVEGLAKKLFNARFANIKSLSGHLSVLAVIYSLTELGDKILITHEDDGGYPLDIKKLGRTPVYYPYRSDNLNIDEEEAEELIKEEKPKLAFFGSSFMLLPHPVKKLVKVVKDHAGWAVFDGSHPLGLIAGGQFQDPLKEGCQVLLGSTHKTFPGPQGGLIVGNDEEAMNLISTSFSEPFVLVDNVHLHRVAALGVALSEMLKYGRSYAKQVVLNSQHLAKALNNSGLKIALEEYGFTRSHMILHKVGNIHDGFKMKELMEQYNIIVDVGVRFGTQAITRQGMNQSHIDEVAKFIMGAFREQDIIPLKTQIKEFLNNFQKPAFCLQDFEGDI